MRFDLMIRAATTASLALLLTGCPWADDDDDGDDDDVTSDDDDTVGDDDDSVPTEILITGEVIARAEESGGILSVDEYGARSGAMVVYLLEDPNDLTNVVWKTTLSGPGTFSAPMLSQLGPLYATVLADCDKNAIIEDVDIRRDYAFNPVVIGVTDLALTLEIEIPDDCRNNGGGGGVDTSPTTTISGPVTLMNLSPAPFVVAAANEPSSHIGWWNYYEAGATEYSITVRDWNGLTNVIAYHDGDGNGLFEPSDNIGGVTSNPLQIGVGDIEGAELLIPSGEPLDLPMPASPVVLQGDVVHDTYTGGNILVRATAFDRNGQLYAASSLPGPGPFALDVPANVQGMVLWAVEDPDTNGIWDLNVDATDLVGPFNTTTSDDVGILLDLEPPPPSAAGISGTITIEQSTSANDRLVVMLLDSATPGVPPAQTLYYGNPGASVDYDIPGLANGTYFVRAWIDFDSDLVDANFAPDEGSGGTSGLVVAGTDLTGVNFIVTEPNPAP